MSVTKLEKSLNFFSVLSKNVIKMFLIEMTFLGRAYENFQENVQTNIYSYRNCKLHTWKKIVGFVYDIQSKRNPKKCY